MEKHSPFILQIRIGVLYIKDDKHECFESILEKWRSWWNYKLWVATKKIKSKVSNKRNQQVGIQSSGTILALDVRGLEFDSRSECLYISF